MTEPLSEKQLEIITLKAELFDLQAQAGQIRTRMEEKLRRLNALLKDEKNEPG